MNLLGNNIALDTLAAWGFAHGANSSSVILSCRLLPVLVPAMHTAVMPPVDAA
jgi:hypothetical protein